LKTLIILGGGEHARSVIDAALQLRQFELLGFVDVAECNRTIEVTGVKRIGGDEELKRFPDACLLLGIGFAPGSKSGLRKQLAEQNRSRSWATVIHPSAVVSPLARVGAGVFVGPNSTILPGAEIGEHAIINSGAIVEHDCRIGAYSHVAPGAVIAGAVTVGDETFVGAGARVRDHLKIGNRCIVGIGAVVLKDVPDNSTVVGIPAKALK
jgi:acetyltransferase EpsM